MSRPDPHSYYDADQPAVEHLDWQVRVDFPRRILAGEATLTLRQPGGGPLDLDTRDLDVQAVVADDGSPLSYTLFAPEPILGARLHVELPAGTRRVRLRYQTSPAASALQWLDAPQTLGGRQPFLFSQCQAIHARSLVPIQDTPALRIRYHAQLTIPRALRAVMAARSVAREETGDEAREQFEMPQPIPPYLLALAVGDLAARDLGPRSRVWAEPGLLDRAAWEFAGVDGMLTAAEALFGPYDWERFDLLVMPPSFPYGGMENPRLTFLTPTVIAGDRSLVGVVAHELAHSWTGNLVSNATWEHFWLNEGFTTYAERRIVEALEGPEVAALHTALGRRALDAALQQQFADRPALTRLRTELTGVDPDEVFSTLPYEKGYLFLLALEQAAGRAAFDRFLRGYIERFRFQALTTEALLAYLEAALPEALRTVDAHAWLYAPGLPESAPQPRSARLEAILNLAGGPPSDDLAARWTATEWEVYVESLPSPGPVELLSDLDRRFGLTDRQNYDLLVSWLTLAARSGYRPALPRIQEVLRTVGRLKYLRPLYGAVARDPATYPLARAWFSHFARTYHPIARQVIAQLLQQEDNAPALAETGATAE